MRNETERKMPAPLKKSEMRSLYYRALAAAKAAGENAVPAPMVVSEADGLSDRPKPGGKSWYVADGVCGFAWVNVKPGNSRFANWLKKNGFARRDSYYGGVSVWISDFGQSYTRKDAAAQAMANVLSEAGIKAYSMSRLD